jgi:hypothetical protein
MGGGAAGGATLPAKQFERIAEGAAWTGGPATWPTQQTARKGGGEVVFLIWHIIVCGIMVCENCYANPIFFRINCLNIVIV